MKPLADFIALDLETTGLDFDSEAIIELAAVRFVDGKPAEEFQAFLPPGKPLTAMARLLTGLDEEALRAAPLAAETLRAFLAFAGGLPLVAHNAEFDATFLRQALEREGLPQPPGPWLDSLLLARIAWPTWDSHRLESLAERLRLPSESAHRALPDARRAGLLLLAAHGALASASEETKNNLRRVTAGLPGWEGVFSTIAGEPKSDARRVGAIGTEPLQTERHIETSKNPDPKIITSIVATLAGDHWLALETPSQVDDVELGWRAALEAGKGKRILLAVPDSAAWNALRKRMAGSRAVALAEPRGYLCRRRLREILADPIGLSPEERLQVLPLLNWENQTSSASIAECRAFSPERARLLWSRVCCDAYGDDPGAKAARSEAEKAEVVLVTHAALLAHLRLEGALLPACDSIVVTGAHALLETVPRACGREVSFFRLRQILQLSDTRPESWFEAEKQFHRFLQKLGKIARRRFPGDAKARYAEPLALSFEANPGPTMAALQENEGFLTKLEETVPEVSRGGIVRVGSRLRDFRLDFEKLCTARDPGAAYWTEEFSNPHKARLRSVPLDLGPDFGRPLRSLFSSGVFLSPALLVNDGGADFFLRSLGMDSKDASEKVRVQGFSEPQPPRFFSAPFAPPSPTMADAGGFARFTIAATSVFPETGFFLLFPSQGPLRSAHQALLPLSVLSPVWAQHVDGNRDALRQLFASARGGLVLATEGMDGLRDGEGLSTAVAVVARMPLPSFREPYLEARAESIRAEGGNPRRDLWHPSGILRLKQDLSVLRHGGNLRAIWFLDTRAIAEGLGTATAQALGCKAETAADLAALQAMTSDALTPRPPLHA